MKQTSATVGDKTYFQHTDRLSSAPTFRRLLLLRKLSQVFIPEDLIPGGIDLIVTVDPSRCILIYRRDDWEPIRNKFLRLPPSPSVAWLKCLFVGNSRDECVSKKHWLPIAPEFHKFAELNKTIYCVRADDHWELWNPRLFREAAGKSWIVRNPQHPKSVNSR